MPITFDRREFIRLLGLGAAGALLPNVAFATKRGGLKLHGTPQTVVILGGGLAGLAAGYELKKAGHQVTILEARKQPGGRVRTIRSFADGQYAEAGANSFPETHSFTFGYATEFNLPLRLILRPGFDSVGHLRGQRFRIGAGGAADLPVSLKGNERQAGFYNMPALYLNNFMKMVGNPRKAGWPPEELRAIDGMTLAELLRDLGASEGAIEIIQASQLGVLGFGVESFSALDGVVTEAIATGAPFYEISGGNDQLPKAMKKRVKKQFVKRAVVKSIAQDEDGVTVVYERQGVIQTIRADRCICTLPFPVLRDIEVTPAFPEDKQRAIEELKLTPVTRTYLQFRQRVWEQDRMDGFGYTDLSIQNVYSPTLMQGGTRGILASYTGGQRALDLGEMKERDRRKLVLRRMEDLFNNLKNNFETSTSMIWHKEEFARGGFTYFEPGQMTELLPVAQRPEGRIHFAGEHTSAWHGWMNGALESGNRAAAEINDIANQMGA